MDKNIPVDMIIIEPTAIEGKHVDAGEIIKKCPTELAFDLAGSGKARPATTELIAEYKERKAKAQAAAAEKAKAEAAAAAKAGDPKAFADALAAAIAEGVAQAVAALKAAPDATTAAPGENG